MTEEMEITITKTANSKLGLVDLNNVAFGQVFTDHMLEADFEDGEWKNIEIKPFGPLSLSPSLSAIHYGQSIFEGIKAYRHNDGEAYIFRPKENYARFNLSAERMCMPVVSEELFLEGMRTLIELDKEWIPRHPDHSLYIRPFMFATGTSLGVKPAASYKFMIILSPAGAYFDKPMKILVEETYTRAAPGGVGFSKNAGNYGGSMLAAVEANKIGYDQVLWTDPFEHKWLQEVGMMNVGFMIDGRFITPSLEEGTILKGITRDSVLTILQEMNIEVEERRINIDELIEAYEQNKFTEIFGMGTAAAVSAVKELRYQDFSMTFDVESAKIAKAVKKRLTELKRRKSGRYLRMALQNLIIKHFKKAFFKKITGSVCILINKLYLCRPKNYW